MISDHIPFLDRQQNHNRGTGYILVPYCLLRGSGEEVVNSMDRIIKIAAALFIVIFVLFAGTGLYGYYVEQRYRTSLVSTYSYTLTISTNEVLRNVTLFIPVPANPNGDSPFVKKISGGTFTGIPAGWEHSLLGSNKATMLKIITPVISGSDGGGFSVRISSDERAGRVIDTRSPQGTDILLRPVQDITEAGCDTFTGAEPGAVCYRYVSAVYADYESSQNARVEISSTVAGKNEWNIFSPAYNQYTNAISALILGENHGWVATKGQVVTGIGSYDVPKI